MRPTVIKHYFIGAVINVYMSYFFNGLQTKVLYLQNRCFFFNCGNFDILQKNNSNKTIVFLGFLKTRLYKNFRILTLFLKQHFAKYKTEESKLKSLMSERLLAHDV